MQNEEKSINISINVDVTAALQELWRLNRAIEDVGNSAKFLQQQIAEMTERKQAAMRRFWPIPLLCLAVPMLLALGFLLYQFAT